MTQPLPDDGWNLMMEVAERLDGEDNARKIREIDAEMQYKRQMADYRRLIELGYLGPLGLQNR